MQLEFRLITGFKLSLVGAQPRHISSPLYLHPENSWIIFFSGSWLCPTRSRENRSVRGKCDGSDPSWSQCGQKWKKVNDRGNFPAIMGKSFKIAYINELVIYLVTIFKSCSMCFYTCNRIIDQFRGGISHVNLSLNSRGHLSMDLFRGIGVRGDFLPRGDEF